MAKIRVDDVVVIKDNRITRKYGINGSVVTVIESLGMKLYVVLFENGREEIFCKAHLSKDEETFGT